MASDIALLVESHPRLEVVVALASCIVADVATDMTTAVTQKVVACYAALCSLLYHRHSLGPQLPSELCERLVVRFEECYADSEVKLCNNILVTLGYCYDLDLIGHVLIVEACKRFVSSLSAMDVELLLTLMQLVGMKLRSDSPGDLVEILSLLNQRVKQDAPKGSEFDQRTRFMLETLTAIKNNRYMNVDAHLAPLRKAMDLRASALQQPLRVSWTDFKNGAQTGQRWWLQAGGQAPRLNKADAGSATTGVEFGDQFLAALAKKLRMNTEMQKRVFIAIMGAEGYLDAAERLAKLSIKGKSERDVVFVLLECCMHEKRYNPFYALLASRLCQWGKGYRMTFLYSIWDHVRNMAHTKSHSRYNLAMVLRHLVTAQLLDMRIFKPVDWVGDMHANLQDFLNTFFSHLIADSSACSNQVLQSIFGALARKKSAELKLLRDGMLLFLRFSLTFKKEMVATPVARDAVRNRLAFVKSLLQRRDGDDDDDDGDNGGAADADE